jgi:hypothetical protein
MLHRLSEHLFWDVNLDEIDPEKHALWRVGRVLEYGRWADWKILAAEYGKPRMAKIVKGLRCLSPKSLAFCCAWFGLPESAFRCLSSDPFNQG